MDADGHIQCKASKSQQIVGMHGTHLDIDDASAHLDGELVVATRVCPQYALVLSVGRVWIDGEMLIPELFADDAFA